MSAATPNSRLDGYLERMGVDEETAAAVRRVHGYPPVVEALRKYRAAAMETDARLLRSIARARKARRDRRPVPERTPWTTYLSDDWMKAGPVRVSDFDRADWPPLQQLRNNDGFAVFEHLDAILDIPGGAS